VTVATGELKPGSILITGRTCVVTGAAQGLGRAIAVAMARFGGTVSICDRKRDELMATADMITAIGAQVHMACLDVRDDEAVTDFMQQTATQFGAIDVLVNNAGGVFWADFETVTPRGEDVMIRENFTSVTSCIRRALPFMPSRGASIINITSIEGHRAAPGFAIYAAMKSAVANLSSTLSMELAARLIRVNCIAPDFIPTEGLQAMSEVSAVAGDRGVATTPWPESATPDDCAAVAVFLASDMSRFITGTTIHLDGGTFAAHGWKVKSDGGFTL
jgi:3-oxoacyl-[acyl-carrier protein] reductase